MPAWVVTYRRYPPPSSKSQPIGALRLGRSSTFQPLNVPTSRRSSILVSHLPYLLPSSVSRNLLCLPVLCDFCIPNGSTGRKLPGCVPKIPILVHPEPGRKVHAQSGRGELTNHDSSQLTCRTVSTPYPPFPTPYPLSSHTLAHSFALFCTLQKLNSFLFNRFRTLRQKTREGLFVD